MLDIFTQAIEDDSFKFFEEERFNLYLVQKMSADFPSAHEIINQNEELVAKLDLSLAERKIDIFMGTSNLKLKFIRDGAAKEVMLHEASLLSQKICPNFPHSPVRLGTSYYQFSQDRMKNFRIKNSDLMSGKSLRFTAEAKCIVALRKEISGKEIAILAALAAQLI